MIFRLSALRACPALPPPLRYPSKRYLSTPTTAPKPATAPPSPIKSYTSTSTDPYLNLSIEHHLLQTSPPDSAILFLYTNRPSIIIGRNQNPWLEVNLALLNATPDNNKNGSLPDLPPSLREAPIDLVRRRSGGGTVFHDAGNVNWTVICPPALFTRDLHAEMVVRALRSSGVARARVNERHDVVLDQGPKIFENPVATDTHTTPYQSAEAPQALKVSGSAYKLTRQRALHHGTCLLNSPHLRAIPHYLRSPAKGYVTAKGVESVSSPVGNIGLENAVFEDAVRAHFAELYGEPEGGVVSVGEEWAGIEGNEGVGKGREELMSPAWTYLQTPQFSFNSHSLSTNSQSTNSNSTNSTNSATISTTPTNSTLPYISFTVRFGIITEATVQLSPDSVSIGDALVGRKLHEIADWRDVLPRPADGEGEGGIGNGRYEEAVRFLDEVLPRVER